MAPPGTKAVSNLIVFSPAVLFNTKHLFVDVGAMPVKVAPSKLIAMSAAELFCINKNFLKPSAAKTCVLVAVAIVGVKVTVFPVNAVIRIQ